METETPAEAGTAEVAVTFRLPRKLKERVEKRMAGRFQTTSEYLRDLIRKDIEEPTAQFANHQPEEAGA